MYNTGARTDHSGTPAPISLGVENSPFTEVLFSVSEKEPISLTRLVENYNSDSLYSRTNCHIVSKAFSIFKNSAVVDIIVVLLSKCRMT